MKTNVVKLLLTVIGAFIFNAVFWEEKIGLNMLLFDAFILSAIFYIYPSSFRSISVRWLLMGHLTCLAMIIIQNTELSTIAFTATLLLLIAFTQYVHRSPWFASGSVLMSFIFFVASFYDDLQQARSKKTRRIQWERFFKIAIVPIILLLVFTMIYTVANSVFSNMLDQAGNYLVKIIYNVSWSRVCFLIFGLYLTGSLILRSRISFFADKERGAKEFLVRTRVRTSVKKHSFHFGDGINGSLRSGMLALKNENTIGIVSLLLLNVLLLVINIIDIRFVWIDFDFPPGTKLHELVHRGTELLILSIFLAMAVLMFFFKGNLNFYKRNKWLKYGAYAWIIQNVILVISVLIRDYYYINHFGLAYKRIGVLFFLFMVLVGLITVFIKISARRTNYFLFRVNAWAGIIVLVLSSTIHWDQFIASYNIAHAKNTPVDVEFLMTLSDKTLPILEQNKNVLKMQESIDRHDQPSLNQYPDYLQRLQIRKTRFLEQQARFSWLSWNVSDSYVRKYFATHPPLNL